MPQRMIRDWTDSIGLENISPEAERLFIRLIMKADDFGRFHADPRLVKAGCFPLIDNLRTNDVIRWLDELSTRHLIFRYRADDRDILAIPNFGQRLKNSRAKFPPIPGESGDWLPTSRNFPELPGTSRNFQPEEKRREDEVEDEVEGDKSPPLSLQNKKSKSTSSAPEIPESLASQEKFAETMQAYREHRKSKRAPMTPYTEKLILAKLAKRPNEAIAMLETAMDAGWQGIEWDWFDNRKQKTINPAKVGKSPPADEWLNTIVTKIGDR